MHAMISPYSRCPGQRRTVSPAGEPGPPANLIPPKDKRTGRPKGADRGEPEKEKDPGSAFGPESVPLATGSTSVVYWVPGPATYPGSRRCQPRTLASTLLRGRVRLHYVAARRKCSLPGRAGRQSTAGLLGPPAVICRFCPVRAAVIIGSRRKFGAWPTCTPWFRGMDHPTWRHVILYAPVSAADAALPLRR